MQFEVPNAPQVYTRVLSNFLGVDFTSISPIERRASNMINLINNNGYLETRPGYNSIGHMFGKQAELNTSQFNFKSIRGSVETNNITIEIIKPIKNNSKLELIENNTDIIIYLATDNNGNIISKVKDITNLTNYLVNISILEGTNEEDIALLLEKTNLIGGESSKINGIWNVDRTTDSIFIIHVEDKLFMLDDTFQNPEELMTDLNNTITQQSGMYLNNKLIIFDGNRTIIYGKFGENWECDYLDNIGYKPTTRINSNPDGTGGTAYEEINNIQPYRINSFLGNNLDKTYKLETKFDDEEPTATLLDDTGTIVTLEIESYDYEVGTVTFTTTPPQSIVEGRDNVFITYKVTNTENIDYINKCTIVTTYGYNGNSNRLFVTGNPDFPNIDWFSAAEDPTYFPVNGFTRIGFEPIINYIKLNDGSLGVQKMVSDTDATIFYRKSALYNNKEVFPIDIGVKTIGCIGKYANANLLNDPLTLTEQGIYCIHGSSYNEKFASERGYFIRNKLLTETNLRNAQAIAFKGKYYLAINNNVYIADSRYKTRLDDAINSDYQYEWYYWRNVPVRTWFTYNNELYFTTKDGDIVEFNNEVYDYNVPMEQLFDTTFLDLNSITKAKTVKKITVISRPYEDNEFTLSYITNENIGDIVNKSYLSGNFPNTLQEREKVRKFMFIKFRLSSDKPKKMNFYKLGIEYIYSGNYRGE